jgi:hypothetical protein
MEIGDINHECTKISIVIFILSVTLRKCLLVCDCSRTSDRKWSRFLVGCSVKHGN